MHNSSPSLYPPTTECQLGRYLNSEDLRRKVSGIPRMVYSNRRLSTRTQASHQGWFPNETTVRNINYLIEPLVTAFFKDDFSWLFGTKQYILSCYLCKIPYEFKVPCIMSHHPFLPTTECHHGRHPNSEVLHQIATGTHSSSVNRIS